MKRPAQHHFRVSLTSSVRARLTLWYLAMMAFIVCLFGGSLYVSQTLLNADAAESRLETQLYQDSQRFAETYKQAVLDRQEATVAGAVVAQVKFLSRPPRRHKITRTRIYQLRLDLLNEW